ncbi:MAG: TetR/AcrR family transcriptional regulator [Candidatus Cloacimonadaceae bacterium]|jgi:AcrR family transcriptional regulator|nr:TetR/AcrR family transcriptional regulator [Candidatus Cloacimonadaceae bacterium]
MELSARQQELVQAAITIIAQRGYEKLTTKNLALQIGVTEAALYRHFSSKRELMEMVLCQFEQLSCAVLEQIKQQQLSALDSIRQFVLNRYTLFAQNPDLARVMFSEELFKNDPSFTAQYQSIMHIHRNEVVGYIETGQQDGTVDPSLSPMQLFRIIVGSMRLIVSQWNISESAFDLVAEGTALLNTIIKLIEVKQ